MRQSLQVATLLALGLAAVEVSLLAWLHTGAWWLVAAATLLAYAGFLSGVFLGDKAAWLPKIFKAIYDIVFTTLVSGLVVTLLVVAGAVAGGVYLMQAWPRSELTVTVYESGFPNDDRVPGIDVIVQDMRTQGPLTKRVTDASGRARFAVEVGAYLLVAVRAWHDGRDEYGRAEPVEIDKIPKASPITLRDIPNDAWLPATDAVLPRAPIALSDMTGHSIEGVTPRIAVTDVPAMQNAPWGLPEAPLILNRIAYSLGFDSTLKVPRWVAHRIQRRDPDYHRPNIRILPDPDIPRTGQATMQDYRGSGYDRGNFVPARDIALLGPEAVRTAFFLSTVAPQVPTMNRLTWLKLEEYTRGLAQSNAEIYAISGTAFANVATTLVVGDGKVAVPTHYFRILARKTPNGNPDVLAFMVPNRSDVDPDFRKYLVPIAVIESATGLHFFPALPLDVRRQIVSTSSRTIWPTLVVPDTN